MWEILPNARGPLIVDACLRIGYTTILLGTLGFFGLGVSPESPDWGSTINEGRKLLRIYVHPALPPALAIMSLVLGLNLLADALREQSHEGLSDARQPQDCARAQHPLKCLNNEKICALTRAIIADSAAR